MEVVGSSYFFKPNHIIIKVNIPVVLEVKKEKGFVPHNIKMDNEEAGMKFDISMSDKPQLIRFTPTKTGKYAIFCDKKLLFFESHREKGMEGIIEVVE